MEGYIYRGDDGHIEDIKLVYLVVLDDQSYTFLEIHFRMIKVINNINYRDK